MLSDVELDQIKEIVRRELERQDLKNQIVITQEKFWKVISDQSTFISQYGKEYDMFEPVLKTLSKQIEGMQEKLKEYT